MTERVVLANISCAFIFAHVSIAANQFEAGLEQPTMKSPYIACIVAMSALTAGCSWLPNSWTRAPSARVVTATGEDRVVGRLLDAEIARPMAPHTRSEEVRGPTPVLMGPLVTIDSYQGDASILLKRMAAANGRSFEVLGTEPRLPLFVHVHAINKDLKSVLADIGSQFGGRADLVLTPSHIQIQYKRAKTL